MTLFLIVKFIDDTTLTETLLTWPHTSIMQTYVEQLKGWITNKHMIINTKKKKEMLIGQLFPALLKF